jgi:fructosamine-3-kinase
VLAPDVVEALLAEGIAIEPRAVRRLHGGSINTCFRLAARDGRTLFLKLNEPDCAVMFAAEAAGLRELAGARAVRVPQPLAHGSTASSAWLLLEFIPLEPGSEAAAVRLGTALAAQHRHAGRAFGWDRDNTIGSTLQRNPWQHDWPAFFASYRLGFQLRLAAENERCTELDEKGAAVLARLPELLAEHRPSPALLHGDLWSGNWAMTALDEPVIFDPAVYYGDREVDLAMTELFGGFPRAFYVAYAAAWPLDPGYPARRDIYNLYHVLNHLNLFGGSYLRQALGMLDRVLNRPAG